VDMAHSLEVTKDVQDTVQQQKGQAI
jgi:hypothetical protein